MLYLTQPDRSEHQPATEAVEYPEPSLDELRRSCGSTVAVILATETATTPLTVQFEDPEKEPVVCGAAGEAEDGAESAEGIGGAVPPAEAGMAGAGSAKAEGSFAEAPADLPTAKPAPDKDGNAAAPAPGTPRPLQLYEGLPLVAHAVTAACRAQVASVCVLAGGDADLQQRIADAAQQAAGQAARKDGIPAPPVTAVSFDPQLVERARKASANFSLFGLPKAVLDEGLRCLDARPEATAALFLACDQVRIGPRHLHALCRRFEEHPDADAVTSWIVWLRRLPILVSRTFLEGLGESPLCRPRANATGGCGSERPASSECPLPDPMHPAASDPTHLADSGCLPSDPTRPADGDRPLPSLRVEEVVFGEEKLAANPTVPPAYEAFSKTHTMSALQAVRLAAELAKADGAEQQGGRAKALGGLNKADRLLVDLAAETLRAQEPFATGSQAARLEAADAWGRRNKLDFPLLGARQHKDSLVYLDSAATTQRVGRALSAMRTFDELENANVYRGAYELSAQATASLNDARKVIEDFIGADRRQTVLTMNATASCNLVAQAWGTRNIGAGDLLVTTLSEHHSNMVPWMMLAQQKGAELAFVPLLPDGRIDQDAYDALLARRPKLVCLAHVSNVLGIVNPVESLAERAHRAGARVMLDAAQSLPHVPLNVHELGCDFVAFSGHKCYGPLGIGGLWVSPEAFGEMDPLAGGGGTISHVSADSYYLRMGAIQYEPGTPPISQAIGLAAAIEYLDGLGMDAVAEHGSALTAYLLDGLRPLDYVTVWGDHAARDGNGGLVSFSLADLGPAQVGAAMGMVGVAVRSGGHCALPLSASMGVVGTTRISFGVHTTKEDIDAALTAIRLCWRLYGEVA